MRAGGFEPMSRSHQEAQKPQGAPKARPEIAQGEALGMMANNRSRPIGPTLPLWGVAVRPRLSTQGFALGFFRSHLWCDIGAV